MPQYLLKNLLKAHFSQYFCQNNCTIQNSALLLQRNFEKRSLKRIAKLLQ